MTWQKYRGVYVSFFILVLSEKERAVAHTPENLPRYSTTKDSVQEIIMAA
jgi:hypothetical protein